MSLASKWKETSTHQSVAYSDLVAKAMRVQGFIDRWLKIINKLNVMEMVYIFQKQCTFIVQYFRVLVTCGICVVFWRLQCKNVLERKLFLFIILCKVMQGFPWQYNCEDSHNRVSITRKEDRWINAYLSYIHVNNICPLEVCDWSIVKVLPLN